MAKPILWSGLEIGTSLADALDQHPNAKKRGGDLVVEIDMFDCDFDATLKFDKLGLAEVSLDLARTRKTQLFVDVRQSIVAALCKKHGRGEARYVDGDLFRKKWREDWVTIDLTAIDDPQFSTISIIYKKIAITDAALKYL